MGGGEGEGEGEEGGSLPALEGWPWETAARRWAADRAGGEAPESRGWRMAMGRCWWWGISPPTTRGGRRGEEEGEGGLVGAVDALRLAGEAGGNVVGWWRRGIARRGREEWWRRDLDGEEEKS